MKTILKIAVLGLFVFGGSVQAFDIFGKTAKEIETNFLRPLTDIKHSISNTSKIFKAIDSPADRIRTAGGFMKEVSIALDRLVAFTDFLNRKFVNSVLSKNVNNKVKNVVTESQEILKMLQKIADEMREYRMNDNQELPELETPATE